MTDKRNTKDKNPFTEITSLLTSNPEVVNPLDYGDDDDIHLVPFSDLLNDNDETTPEK